MEIKPLKEYGLPKFALALAAAAVAGTMTACGPVRTGGDVPMTDVETFPSETEEQIMGLVEVSPEMETEEVTETTDAATEMTTKITETTCVELAGDVDVIEETRPTCKAVAAPGMGPSHDCEDPDFSDSIRDANQKAAAFAQEFCDAFAAQGVELTRDEAEDMSDVLWHSTGEKQVMVCFYDSEAEQDGLRAGDQFREIYSTDNDRWYDWGCVRTLSSEEGIPELREIQIDIRSCETMTVELAAKLAQEAMT